MNKSIETMNKYVVSTGARGVIIGVLPISFMTPDDALLLAAWLVAIAEYEASHEFSEVLEAVQNS